MATIVLLGTLDTKTPEYTYIRTHLLTAGHQVLLIDTGILGEGETGAPGEARAADEVGEAGEVGWRPGCVPMSLRLRWQRPLALTLRCLPLRGIAVLRLPRWRLALPRSSADSTGKGAAMVRWLSVVPVGLRSPLKPSVFCRSAFRR